MQDRRELLETYKKSVTSQAWSHPPYDISIAIDSKDEWEDRILTSTELIGILEEELNIENIPEWAREIVGRQISSFPPCGHYTFPRPLLEIVNAIKREKCPNFVISCYTADVERKDLMSYYIYCLDSWMKKAPIETALAELQMRDALGKDWKQILSNIYKTLGKPTEERALVVQRLIHRLRWWIKTLVWFDDQRNRFQLDTYSGDIRGDAELGYYGNPPFADPYYMELRLPETQEMTKLIRDKITEGDELIGSDDVQGIEQTWLCAPKVFRYLERLIIRIGNIGSDNKMDVTGSILQCEDTYPDFKSYERWYSTFMNSLVEWLQGTDGSNDDFGEHTLIRHWLFRILQHKLQLLEQFGTFGKLIGVQNSGMSGRKII